MVKIWSESRRASSFVVNQHGEYLLHVRTGPYPLMILAEFNRSWRDMHMRN